MLAVLKVVAGLCFHLDRRVLDTEALIEHCDQASAQHVAVGSRAVPGQDSTASFAAIA